MNTYEKQGGGGIRHAKQNLPFRKTDPVGAYPPAPTCPGPVGSFSGSRVTVLPLVCHCIGEATVSEWF
jgi:hypothetical protein